MTIRACTAADYERLLDADIHRFIARSEAFYEGQPQHPSVEEQRRSYDALCADFRPNDLPKLKTIDRTIEGQGGPIPIRDYFPDDSADAPAHILFFHGGGYVVGSLESHDDLCIQIAHRTGLPITAVDYRLAPEHPFPACWQDAMTAFDKLAEHTTKPIITLGDSAGGNLAAAICHARRSHPRAPVGQLLIYPGLGIDLDTDSCRLHTNAPGLTLSDTQMYKAFRAGGDVDNLANPQASPLLDPDFAGLPPTIVISATCDPLHDDGDLYCQRIAKAGGTARFTSESGLIHGYLRARHDAPLAAASFDRICDGLVELAQ